MKKKAQGISINVIIIAAIALLVLVILAVLLLRTGGGLDEETSKCGYKGGVCQEMPCQNPDDSIPDGLCPDDKPYCCAKFRV